MPKWARLGSLFFSNLKAYWDVEGQGTEGASFGADELFFCVAEEEKGVETEREAKEQVVQGK